MNDLLSQREAVRADLSMSRPRPSCPQPERGGFCVARIHPKCLRIDSQGTVRVSLAASPQVWFETLSRLGEVLHVTRNPISGLTRRGRLPCLGPWPDSPLPTDAARAYRPNLAEYARLWAIRVNSPACGRYGLEIRDAAGMEFERILLPPESDHALFVQFVLDHQSPPEETGSWLPPNHATSTQRRTTLASRIPRLRAQWATGDRGIRRLPSSFVPKLLAAAACCRVQLRTTSYHPALLRRVTWTPQHHGATRVSDDGLELLHGGDADLQLNHRGIRSVWLWKGRCPCCAEQRWSIEVGDGRDHVGLSFAAGEETPELDWRRFIRAVASPRQGQPNWPWPRSCSSTRTIPADTGCSKERR